MLTSDLKIAFFSKEIFGMVNSFRFYKILFAPVLKNFFFAMVFETTATVMHDQNNKFSSKVEPDVFG